VPAFFSRSKSPDLINPEKFRAFWSQPNSRPNPWSTAGILLFFLWATAAGYWLLKDHIGYPTLTGTLPCVNLAAPDGGRVDTCSLNPPFVLIFIDRNCQNCREVVRSVHRYRVNHPGGDRLIFILRQNRDNPIMEPTPIGFGTLKAPATAWREKFQIRATPTLIYVGRDLKIIRRQVGRRLESGRVEGFRQFFREGVL